MLLAELQSLAASLGIKGTGRMRKGALIEAIQAKQSELQAESEQVGQVARPQKGTDVAEHDISQESQSTAVAGSPTSTDSAPSASAPVTAEPAPQSAPSDATDGHTPQPAQEAVSGAESAVGTTSTVETPQRRTRRATRPAGPPTPSVTEQVAATADATSQGSADSPASAAQSATEPAATASADAGASQSEQASSGEAQTRPEAAEAQESGEGRQESARSERRSRGRGRRSDDAEAKTGEKAAESGASDQAPSDAEQPTVQKQAEQKAEDGKSEEAKADQKGDTAKDGKQEADSGAQRQRDGQEDGEGGGRRRRGRHRDRRKRDRSDAEPAISDDDVLVPVAGILDVLDNYAFIRTSGYLAGPNDVYVSMSQIRKYGLRRGDAITGAVRAPREGENTGNRREKYNPLVRLDTINGMDPEEAKHRPEFYKLTPLYPQERLRLETEPHILTTRVIDLIMPIGKGQRALIVSPPKAGKTTVLQAIANGITRNNPECHLMVVLVDERPEEVTDMQRSVKGEVIAATFDRPPSDHTTLAELAIERAKRLVELGHDVVVLLDSITRMGRSYNLAAPASGRIMSGGIDSTALYPPKRFLGAARNIENGGSLTIIANALVETGSMMDTVIFEEFKATGNAELKLDRKIADRRVFPAVDVNASSTRKEEILLSPDELAIVHKLRRVLAALEPQQALDLLLDRLKKTKNNVEFLMQVAKGTPGE